MGNVNTAAAVVVGPVQAKLFPSEYPNKLDSGPSAMVVAGKVETSPLEIV